MSFTSAHRHGRFAVVRIQQCSASYGCIDLSREVRFDLMDGHLGVLTTWAPFLVPILHSTGWQEGRRLLADCETIGCALSGGITEMEADENARISVLVRCLCETIVRAHDRLRTIALVRWQRAPAILEGHRIGAQHLF